MHEGDAISVADVDASADIESEELIDCEREELELKVSALLLVAVLLIELDKVRDIVEEAERELVAVGNALGDGEFEAIEEELKEGEELHATVDVGEADDETLMVT